MYLPIEGQSELLRLCTAELVLIRRQLTEAHAEIENLKLKREVQVVDSLEVCLNFSSLSGSLFYMSYLA